MTEHESRQFANYLKAQRTLSQDEVLRRAEDHRPLIRYPQRGDRAVPSAH